MPDHDEPSRGAHSEFDPSRRLTVDQILRRSAHKFADAVALRYETEILSYAELDARVDRVAHALARRGVQHGDRVALLMRNCVEFVEAVFACARLGAIAVPVNFRLSAAELTYILADSGATVVIAEDACAETLSDALTAETSVSSVAVIGPSRPFDGAVDYHEMVGTGEAPQRDPEARDTDPAFILYTSGTTGRPKGAVLTNLAMTIQASDRAFAQNVRAKDEVWLAGTQLFHVTGLSALLTSVLIGGEFITIGRGGTTAAEIADLMEQYRVTTCSLVPAQWKEFAALPDLRSRNFVLERLSWGSAPSEPAVLERLHEVFDRLEILTVYGMTESGGVSTALSGDEARESPGSIGRALPTVDVRIVDEHMNDVEAERTGEIVLRGPSIMAEYWNNPEATASAFAGGWLHTGDIGYLDRAGLLWIVDRKKDIIISGGENIYSAEVEGVIARHPKVADVAVVGAPHPRWGETPVAVVVPHDPEDPPTYDEIVEHTLGLLASFKKPSEVVVVDTLPRGTTGKVQKFRLRDTVPGKCDA